MNVRVAFKADSTGTIAKWNNSGARYLKWWILIH